MEGQTLFTFEALESPAVTAKLIEDAVLSIYGKVKHKNGFLRCSWPYGKQMSTVRYDFYVGQVVRAVPYPFPGYPNGLLAKEDGVDKKWNPCVEALLRQNPDFDLSSGKPSYDCIMYADGEIKQVYKSTNTPAYGKAILGGALFGEVGAVVGAMGGTSRMTGYTKAANQVYMKVRMSNGRIREGKLSVRSRIYNEIIVNMK